MGYAMLVVAVLLSILAQRIGMHIPETAIIVGLLALMGGGMLWNGRGGMG